MVQLQNDNYKVDFIHLLNFRYGRLLLVIPLLRMIRVETTEQIFFKETVGETNINNIIVDVYNTHPFSTI